MTLMKFVVGIMTGSIGILSEAAHSLLDLGAASLTYFAVRECGKPADEEHHYGHSKIESISALIETGLLFFTSFIIIYEAGKRLIFGGASIEVTWYAFAVMLISIAIDFSRAHALKKVAKETGSQALEADALHFSSDILTASVVIIGLIGVAMGYANADAYAALAVALFVMRAGWQLGRRTIDVLIDAAPAGIADEVTTILQEVKGVIRVERVRARMMGPNISLDGIIYVDITLRGEEIARIIASAEHAIRERVPDADILLHTKPVANNHKKD